MVDVVEYADHLPVHVESVGNPDVRAEYDAAHGPAIYRNKVWKKPSGPPVHLSFEQSDQVPNVIALEGPQVFAMPGTSIEARVTGKPYAGQRILERADLFVLYMLRDAYPERPFFISRTTGTYEQEMGLAPYMVSTGLARKLLPAEPKAGQGYLQVPGEGWVDGATTRAPHEQLSDREFEVLRALGSGMMVKDVAAQLRLSAKTVSTYRTRLLEKMGLKSKADLVRYVVAHDLLK